MTSRLFCAVVLWSAVAFSQDVKLPDGPGKEVTLKICGKCHGIQISISKPQTRDGWNSVINDMVQRGAVGTDDEFGDIIEYLTVHFSKNKAGTAKSDRKIQVNSATAKDFAEVLGVSEKQAVAIVEYRREKGALKSAEELAKVPGVDAAKVEANKNRLIF